MNSNHPPYPSYKPSRLAWLGDVPANWEVRRLRDSVSDCVGGVWGSEPNGIDDLPCVRVADFDRQRLRVHMDDPTIRAITPSERRQRILTSGDLLLEKSGGGALQPVGVVMLYDHGMPAVCSNFVALLRVRTGFDPVFLTYLHSALYTRRLNVRSIKQTTGIQNLDTSAYLRERVSIPPLSEQNAIVRYLDHVDGRIQRYIEAKEKLILLLQEARQATIHRAVTRGLDPDVPLRPSGVEWVGDVPTHWELRRAKYLYREVNERSSTGAEELMSVSHKTGVTPRKKNVTMFRAETNVGYKLCRPGDIVVNTMWAYMAALGVARQVGLVSPSYNVYRPINGELLHQDYTDPLLRTETYRSEYYVRSTGITSSRLRLYPKYFLDIPLLYPPVPEQVAIAAYLEKATADIDNAIATARRQCELMQEYRTSLIAHVVTGKLDVRNAVAQLPQGSPEQEPAVH